jgi:hypothetical protein
MAIELVVSASSTSDLLLNAGFETQISCEADLKMVYLQVSERSNHQ